ncbi:MAG: hypothetical protein AAGA60_07640 [Cyanobacteria bacterium P01_E01_bin.42]
MGQPVPVFDRTLGDDPIVSSEGWEWLQAHKFAGTIGKPGSPADLADRRLKLLFLKQNKTEAQWDALEAAEFSDIRGRCLIAGGRGDGLSDRSLWEIGGEESHAPNLLESALHDHGGGNHSHSLSGSGYFSHTGVLNIQGSNPSGGQVTATNSSGNILQPQGGNQPFNIMQPYLAVPTLIFLGVLA